MRYKNTCRAVFRERPNRFIARVEMDGALHTVHVKNTGRCRELLVPGCTVILSASDNSARKTKYDLIAVYKERPGQTPLLVNMDSQASNDTAAEWLPVSGLFAPDAVIRREVTFGQSRFDFQIREGEKITFLEVKGVTLEEDGIVRFPDAPTERGVRHLRHLTDCVQKGYGAAVLFVIQMSPMRQFRPNDRMHREFGDALRQAAEAGVRVLAMECEVTEDSLRIAGPVPVNLDGHS